MTTIPVPLAPAVIKSLANKLSQSPELASKKLTRAQSIEAMSRILGHASWYAAQQQDLTKSTTAFSNTITVNLDDESLQLDALVADAKFRRRVYDDLIAMLQASVNIVWCAQTLLDSGKSTGDKNRFAFGHHFLDSLQAGATVSDFFGCLRFAAPLELLAIQFSEKHIGLLHGLKEARRICP